MSKNQPNQTIVSENKKQMLNQINPEKIKYLGVSDTNGSTQDHTCLSPLISHVFMQGKIYINGS